MEVNFECSKDESSIPNSKLYKNISVLRSEVMANKFPSKYIF